MQTTSIVQAIRFDSMPIEYISISNCPAKPTGLVQSVFSARRGVQHLSLPNTFLRRAAMLKTLCIIIHYLAPPICSIRHAMHSRAMARAHRVPSAPTTPIFPMDVDFAVPCQSSAPVRLESDSHSSAYVFCSDLPPKNPASRQCPCASLTLYLDLVG